MANTMTSKRDSKGNKTKSRKDEMLSQSAKAMLDSEDGLRVAYQ
jgi:hypothetical protein